MITYCTLFNDKIENKGKINISYLTSTNRYLSISLIKCKFTLMCHKHDAL